jgi:glyoxylase-like metal-dependent hydrolase (beta-lactamase superfamily II)
MRSIAFSIVGALLISCTESGCTNSSAAQDLTVETFQSDLSGPAVDSHLILGATEAVLVDAQFYKADAEKVVALVKASGKSLTTVFLTHAHPDHYMGLTPIHEAFPQAKVVTTPAVLADFQATAPSTFAYWQGQLGSQVADKLTTPEALSGNTIRVDNQVLTIIEVPHEGESKTAAMLSLPGNKALIAGDLIYHDVHLVLGDECAPQGWLDNLAAVKAMGFETIYPGHGLKDDVSGFDVDAEYIRSVVPIMDAAATPTEAVATIKAKYPGYASDFLLSFTVDGYFTNCKKAH